MPISYGGIGLRRLIPTCDAAHVASWLQCARAVADSFGDAAPAVRDWQSPAIPAQRHFHQAIKRLYDDYEIDALALCEATLSDLVDVERPKQQQVLSKSVSECVYRRWRSTAAPRTLQTALSASSVGGRAGPGDWLRAVPFANDSLCR